MLVHWLSWGGWCPARVTPAGKPKTNASAARSVAHWASPVCFHSVQYIRLPCDSMADEGYTPGLSTPRYASSKTVISNGHEYCATQA